MSCCIPRRRSRSSRTREAQCRSCTTAASNPSPRSSSSSEAQVPESRQLLDDAFRRSAGAPGRDGTRDRFHQAGWGVTLALLAMLLPVGVFGEDLDARRTRALSLFDAALRADRTAITQAHADLAGVLAERPNDALARVHFGWLLLLEARELPLLEARARAGEGLKEMDAAVDAAPHDPVVRLVRARCGYQLPLVLGREPLAEADFKWLLSWLAGESAAPPLPAEALRREIYFHAGAFALKRRDAIRAVHLLEQAAAVPASSPSDDDVQSMLALARRELSSQGHGQAPHPDQG